MLAALAIMLGLAACVPDRQAPVTPIAASIAASRYGVIIAMRQPFADNAVRDSILGAIGGAKAAGAGSPGAGAGAVEFIIRDDAGQTLSVVQPDTMHFRTGERVVLAGGEHTRIARVSG